MYIVAAGLMLLAVAALAAWGKSERRRRIAERELARTLQLFEVSLEVNSTILKRDLLQKIMETSERIMDAEASSVILVDPEKGDLFFELALGGKGDEVREIRLRMGEGIAGWVAETGQPVKIDDAARDERWSSKVANRVDYPTRTMLCVPLMSKGEVIGVLQVLNKRGGKIFTDRDLKLLQSIAAPAAMSLENAMLYDALEKSLHALKDTVAAKERMESELRIASQIQMGFLPRSGTASAPAGIDATIRPAREVGGDFYDFFPLGDNTLFFTLGDVSDKGIPAALFMAATMTLIKGKMREGMTPGELLTQVNRELYKDDSAMFATIFCGMLDTGTGRLLYSDGGHCTPYIVRSDGAVEPLRGSKSLPLGVLDDTDYADNENRLEPGERLVLYTDGISEAEDPERLQYGTARLQELLDRERIGGAALLKSIVADVDRFARGAVQSDDIAVLTVERV